MTTIELFTNRPPKVPGLYIARCDDTARTYIVRVAKNFKGKLVGNTDAQAIYDLWMIKWWSEPIQFDYVVMSK